MGDALRRKITERVAIASPGFILLYHRKPWDTYLLHDLSAHPLLVRLYRFG